MSRLLNYLGYSGLDEDTNKFRAMNIKLSDKKDLYKDIVHNIEERYNTKISNILEKLNKELRKSHKGKWWFGLCLDEDKSLDNIRIGKKVLSKKLRKALLEANDKLSDIKLKVEKDIKNKAFTTSNNII